MVKGGFESFEAAFGVSGQGARGNGRLFVDLAGELCFFGLASLTSRQGLFVFITDGRFFKFINPCVF